MTKRFSVKSKVWLYPGKAAWHFVTIPTEIAKEIDTYFAHAKHGWGSLPVLVTIGNTTWKTSIFPDNKTQAYLLPIKKEVRKKELLEEGLELDLCLEISD